MKAIVFCNFPVGLSEKLKAELVERGVTIIHFGGIEEKTKVSNPGCEGIIAFYEIMSHNQTDKAKAWAREWGVPFFLLSRKSSTWGKQLPDLKSSKTPAPEPAKPSGKPKSLTYTETILHSPEVIEEAPPSIRPPVVDEVLDRQWDEIKELFIEEVEDLKTENADLNTKLAEANRQRTHLISQVEDFKKRVESKDHQIQELKKSVSELPTLKDQVLAYKKLCEENKRVLGETRGQLDAARTSLHNAMEEIMQLNGRLGSSVTADVYNAMVAKYEATVQELEAASKRAPAASVDPTIASIQHLFNLKMLDEETAGKMLVKAILHTA